MRPAFRHRPLALFLAAVPILALAKELAPPPPLSPPTRTAYRQVLPDGHIVYSDKPVKGARIEEKITVDVSPQGIRLAPTPHLESKPVERGPSVPPRDKPETRDETTDDVLRAKLLLEDARKRQEAGIEPLPGERTGTATGGSRLNETYHARQKRLAEDVAIAENMLRKAIAERDALRNGC